MSRILPLIPVLFAVAACATTPSDGSIPLPAEGEEDGQTFTLADLVPAQAAARARQAHASGDHRLYAVMGYALIFPGASREQAQTLGYRVIAGTSDNFRSDQERRFNDAAHAYAAAWNREMLRLTGET